MILYGAEPTFWNYGNEHYVAYRYTDTEKPHVRHWPYYHEAHCRYTPLRSCARCGRLGAYQKIRYAYDMWPAMEYIGAEFDSENNYLCFACMNVIAPLLQRLIECSEIDKLIRKIKRVASHARKSLSTENHRPIESHVGQDACRA